MIVWVFMLLPFFGKAAVLINSNDRIELPENQIQMLKTFVGDSSFSIDKIENRKFTSFSYDSLNNNNQAYWLKVELENQSNNKDFYFATSLFDNIILHYPSTDSTYLASKGGKALKLEEREYVFGSHSYLPISLKKGKQTLYICPFH